MRTITSNLITTDDDMIEVFTFTPRSATVHEVAAFLAEWGHDEEGNPSQAAMDAHEKMAEWESENQDSFAVSGVDETTAYDAEIAYADASAKALAKIAGEANI